eukprot:CAMPEP_0170535382 /NCGR_PEP_ID=MMETSP0209-20121228/99856_1 /TAXON_ID=665100 ORGANISM="Litonotus pictus, Strain P1" /NCGR_SAMPLE_ID=MMETSP0209 /ASSEMBLY_ACC=CAM_ASM_000301 /LENGTH=169 /DNA_ID=CAMNT_0010836301 /DNA_START=136 /DNA_END=641 /DNA_ORIENTATION=+
MVQSHISPLISDKNKTLDINQEMLKKSEDEDHYNNLYLEYYNSNKESNPISVFSVDDKSNPKVIEMFYREVLMAKVFGGNIIYKKGLIDVITNGRVVYLVCNPGSLKRCGGIGDILGGTLSAFISMWTNRVKGSCIEKDIKEIRQFKLNQIVEICALSGYYCRKLSEIA